MKFPILIMLIMLSLVSCQKTNDSNFRTIVYSHSDEVFTNPERGFYKHPSAPVGNLTQGLLTNNLNNGYSLVIRVNYLKDFRTSPISDDYLSKLDKDFQVMRTSGVKCILRFAYTDNPDEGEQDPTLTQILSHLDQLKPLLEKNVDVIATMQAGFIGAWGEWYYTTAELKTVAARNAIISKILEVLPKSRAVQARTPGYKQGFTRTSTPLGEQEAFSGSDNSRVGHHNDCFMASVNDYGTYSNVAIEKAYIAQEGLYVPVGGETCPPSGIAAADCAKAESEMRMLRWSYLNQDYYLGVNNLWKAGGCMDNIIRNMGYRFVLNKGEFTQQHSAGSEFKIKLSLTNIGYASPYNSRLVELVLVNNDNGTYKVTLPVDPRRWEPNKEQLLEFSVKLPENIEGGDYKLYINLPDPELTLYNNPLFSIRLANVDCWRSSTGYNSLNYTVTINNALTLPISLSQLYFEKQ